jgi:hypothetical protein
MDTANTETIQTGGLFSLPGGQRIVGWTSIPTGQVMPEQDPVAQTQHDCLCS